MKIRNTTSLLILALGFWIGSKAQTSTNYEQKMLKAITIHDLAKDATSEIEALRLFEEISRENKDQWLPDYWAAYLCTQIARLEGRVDDFPQHTSGESFLLKSLEHLKKAKQKNTQATPSNLSNMKILEGFIYSFYPSLLTETEEKKSYYKELSKRAYQEAVSLKPRNHNMFVLNAIKLSRSKSYRDKVSALALFDHSESLYQSEPNRALTTFWAMDFIQFWRANTEKSLEEYPK